MYENLISIEIDTIGIEKHTYIQTYIGVWKMSTNQNRWYQMKAYIHKKNMSIQKDQNWYQLKEFNDTNWTTIVSMV